MVVVDNLGGMAAPVNITVTYVDGSSENIHQTPAIWIADQKQARITISTKKEIKAISLYGGIWMDADISNNSWKKK